jgi:DNA-binding XRE family transcriptional regulator
VLDLTRAELTWQVGCALETIRKIERGARRPSKQIAERLADQLGVAPHERTAFLQFARAMPAPGTETPADAVFSAPGQERAYELLTIILQHPASTSETRDQTACLLAELEPESAEQARATSEQLPARSLESIVEALLETNPAQRALGS